MFSQQLCFFQAIGFVLVYMVLHYTQSYGKIKLLLVNSTVILVYFLFVRISVWHPERSVVVDVGYLVPLGPSFICPCIRSMCRPETSIQVNCYKSNILLLELISYCVTYRGNESTMQLRKALMSTRR